jgi:hypothetical protein
MEGCQLMECLGKSDPGRQAINIMNIESIELDRAVLLKVSGRMDADNAHEFEQACNQWISKEHGI